MHRELIGQEASLSLPSDIEATDLLVEFVHELMDADGSEIEEPERLAEEIKRAVGSICDGAAESGCRLLASFAIRDDGIEIRVRRDDDPRGPEGGAAVVTARAA